MIIFLFFCSVLIASVIIGYITEKILELVKKVTIRYVKSERGVVIINITSAILLASIFATIVFKVLITYPGILDFIKALK